MKYICLLLFLSLTLSVRAQTPALTIPSFHFLQKSGKMFGKENIPAGKPVVFIFFDVTCEHCRQSMQYLDTQTGKFKNCQLYLVTMDPGSSAEAFLSTYGPGISRMKNTLLLRDTRRQFIIAFGPKKFPSLFVYSSKQQLLFYCDEEKDLDRFVQAVLSAK